MSMNVTMNQLRGSSKSNSELMTSLHGPANRPTTCTVTARSDKLPVSVSPPTDAKELLRGVPVDGPARKLTYLTVL